MRNSCIFMIQAKEKRLNHEQFLHHLDYQTFRDREWRELKAESDRRHLWLIADHCSWQCSRLCSWLASWVCSWWIVSLRQLVVQIRDHTERILVFLQIMHALVFNKLFQYLRFSLIFWKIVAFYFFTRDLSHVFFTDSGTEWNCEWLRKMCSMEQDEFRFGPFHW